MKDNFLRFGRSGCTFSLNPENLNLIKISSKADYNDRLYSQYLKQLRFVKSNTLTEFSTPKLYGYNKNEKLHSFEMEYVHGKTFEMFCIDSNKYDIQSFCNNLISFIRSGLDSAVDTSINFELLESKLKRLNEQLNFEYDVYVRHLLRNPISKIPIGMSHGDLTMSNIIFSDRYYLIDFLDNIFESPLNDLAKVKQDTQHNFYFNFMSGYNTKVKVCLEFIDRQINHHFDDVIYTDEFIWISIFNLLRVLPYVNNNTETKTLINGLKSYEYHITGGRKV